jgi:hypothetical protein
MTFLTRQFFDILVLIVAALGLILGARQLLHDFRAGPRTFRILPPPDDPHSSHDHPNPDQPNNNEAGNSP